MYVLVTVSSDLVTISMENSNGKLANAENKPRLPDINSCRNSTAWSHWTDCSSPCQKRTRCRKCESNQDCVQETKIESCEYVMRLDCRAKQSCERRRKNEVACAMPVPSLCHAYDYHFGSQFNTLFAPCLKNSDCVRFEQHLIRSTLGFFKSLR